MSAHLKLLAEYDNVTEVYVLVKKIKLNGTLGSSAEGSVTQKQQWQIWAQM